MLCVRGVGVVSSNTAHKHVRIATSRLRTLGPSQVVQETRITTFDKNYEVLLRPRQCRVQEFSTQESGSLRQNQKHNAELASLRLVHRQRIGEFQRTAIPSELLGIKAKSHTSALGERHVQELLAATRR